MKLATNHIFKRITNLYSLLFIGLISAILLVTYFFFTNEITNNLVASNKELLTQINSNIDLRLLQIDQTIIKFIQSDKNLSKYMSDDFNNKDDYVNSVLSLQNQINSYITSDPNIHSIYIYSKRRGQILTDENAYNFNDFYDVNFLHINKDNLVNGNWFPTRDLPNLANSNRSNRVITLIRSFPIIQQGVNPHGYIVVNVDEQIMRNVINKITPRSLGTIVLLNNDGQIISTKNDTNLNQISNITKSVALYSKAENFFEMNKMFIFSKTSNYTKWRYVSIAKKADIFSSLNHYFALIILLWIVLIAISLFLNNTISKISYRPIDSLFKFIIAKNMNNDIPNNYSLSKVKSEVSNLINDRINLEKQAKDNFPIIKWRLIFDLIMGSQTDYNKLKPQLEMFNIKLDDANFIVMVVKPIYNNHFSNEDLLITKLNTEIIIQKFIDETCNGVCVELNGSFILLLSFENHDEENNTIIATSCAQLIKENIDCNCIIGIGNQSEALNGVNESYLQANEALKYHLVFECDDIISINDVNLYKSTKLYKYANEIDKLILSLKSTNINEIRSTLAKIYEKALINKVPPEFIYQISAQIITRAIEEMSNLEIDIHKLLGCEYSVEYYTIKEILISFSSINELQRYLENIFECFVEEIISHKKSNDKSEKVIDNITKYVQENYMLQQLSLNYIAEKFGYTPNYLSTIFKQIYGTSFINYLINIRLEKSKELLLTSKMSINQIAENVGYTTHHGFIRTFKKYTGLAPAEYRLTKQSK